MSTRRTFTFGNFARGSDGLQKFWSPTLTAKDPQIPNLPLETATTTQQLVVAASGGIVFAGATLRGILRSVSPSGGIAFAGAASLLRKAIFTASANGLLFSGVAAVTTFYVGSAQDGFSRDGRRRGFSQLLFGRS